MVPETAVTRTRPTAEEIRLPPLRPRFDTIRSALPSRDDWGVISAAVFPAIAAEAQQISALLGQLGVPQARFASPIDLCIGAVNAFCPRSSYFVPGFAPDVTANGGSFLLFAHSEHYRALRGDVRNPADIEKHFRWGERHYLGYVEMLQQISRACLAHREVFEEPLGRLLGKFAAHYLTETGKPVPLLTRPSIELRGITNPGAGPSLLVGRRSVARVFDVKLGEKPECLLLNAPPSFLSCLPDLARLSPARFSIVGENQFTAAAIGQALDLLVHLSADVVERDLTELVIPNDSTDLVVLYSPIMLDQGKCADLLAEAARVLTPTGSLETETFVCNPVPRDRTTHDQVIGALREAGLVTCAHPFTARFSGALPWARPENPAKFGAAALIRCWSETRRISSSPGSFLRAGFSTPRFLPDRVGHTPRR